MIHVTSRRSGHKPLTCVGLTIRCCQHCDHDKSAFKALWCELDLRRMRIDSLELCQQGLQIDALLDFFESTFSDVRSEATGATSNS